jgi:hypothetical protein
MLKLENVESICELYKLIKTIAIAIASDFMLLLDDIERDKLEKGCKQALNALITVLAFVEAKDKQARIKELHAIRLYVIYLEGSIETFEYIDEAITAELKMLRAVKTPLADIPLGVPFKIGGKTHVRVNRKASASDKRLYTIDESSYDLVVWPSNSEVELDTEV